MGSFSLVYTPTSFQTASRAVSDGHNEARFNYCATLNYISEGQMIMLSNFLFYQLHHGTL